MITIAPRIPYYNITEATDGNTTLVDMLRFVSDPDKSSYSPFDFIAGHMVLISIFMIIFLSLKLRGVSTPAAFAACCIVNFVVTILIYPLQIITSTTLIIGICLLPISGFILFLTKNI